MSASIREEGPGDEDGIRAVELAAFGREAEALLVDEVRELGIGLLSLVATDADAIVGHVLFTPATIGHATEAALLGPLAVHPDHQGVGIGGLLVQEGLRRLAERGVGAVVLVGSHAYYARFGFVPGASHGVTSTRVDGEHVLALELRPKALGGGGELRWAPVFDRV